MSRIWGTTPRMGAASSRVWCTVPKSCKSSAQGLGVQCPGSRDALTRIWGATPATGGCSAQDPGVQGCGLAAAAGLSRLTPAVEALAPHGRDGSAPHRELCARQSAVRICT